ncbi:MAG: ECF transporter S component [Clostridia bacterium]|nr:ECF transporter S component [Clostridia bacterium]
MTTVLTHHTNTATRRLCLTAVFAALTCAGTFVSVPLPIGYFNLGDIFVLCAAWMLGPILGASSAAVGSALADILMGFPIYAPGTFVIKGGIALTAALLLPLLAKIIKNTTAVHLLAAICGEAVMVGGYFLYESVILGYGAGAAASLPGNTLQAVCGVIGAVMLYRLLYANRAVRRFLG